MQILYVPQFNFNDTITYEFDGNKITATINGESDVFDFTGMMDGTAQSWGREPNITSSLPVCPIIDAIITNGVLSVRLINYIGNNATDEEKFPEWVTV